MDMFFGLEAAEIARHTQRVKEALDRWQIDASYFHPLTQLTQYEFIILFANTESVVQNGRKQLLEETLALIADISTVLTGKGIRVHFVNGKDQWDNQTAGDVTNRTRDTAIKYHGRKRQLGSKLRRFVMEPFLSDRFSHPGTSITVILTDGKVCSKSNIQG
ncbi:uncharacterized protein BDV17DRAFT_20827 [Aspergillus undulatus]|uniref:uncharacterized protein n=1 Tax=Aspergillus undulatus TaxID=1810928 RepID=UPI003CCDB0F0